MGCNVFNSEIKNYREVVLKTDSFEHQNYIFIQMNIFRMILLADGAV